LKRAGCSREAIAERLSLPLEDLIRVIGPESDPYDAVRPLAGTWRYVFLDREPLPAEER
jgi:hypothetical protein